MRRDGPLIGYGVVLGTPDVRIESAQSRLLVQLVHSAQETEPFLQSVCTCTMSWVLSELSRLRFWHSHEKTIEIAARLVADGDWNVRATVLYAMCSLAFCATRGSGEHVLYGGER